MSREEKQGARHGTKRFSSWGSGQMLKRGDSIKACLVGAVLSGVALFSTAAFAQQECCQGGSAIGANLWTSGNATSDQWPANAAPAAPTGASPLWTVKAPPSAPSPSSWWTHGEIEFGGQAFTNAPPSDGSGAPNSNVWQRGQNLANYYEYSTVAPGAFGGGHIATGSNDGLYQADLWANNIGSNFNGFSDQAYMLDLSKIGEQYLTFQWDETPHVYSTTAQTPYLGVGTNSLTLPPGATGVTSAASLIPFLHQTDIGIQRNTASVDYRWTPTDAWDVGANYSHMDRTGTIVQGVAMSNPGGPAAQVPAPVNDTTQNFGANGEYAGISPWGGKYTFKAEYSGSVYTDHISDYTVQTPFANASSPIDQLSTWPSNDANGVSGVLAADLPAKSRYVGVVDYTMMQQNATFQAMTDNPAAVASPYGGIPWNAVNFGFINGNLADPTTSLHGQINTLMSDNILTTNINPDLTSKLTYRYYDFDNQTPRIVFPEWVVTDGTGSSVQGSISSLVMGYIKQDGGAALNWRPSREWNFNGEFGWERYDYTETDANVTNEYSGKLSADWKPTGWLTARADGYYADRRYNTYDYDAFVASLQYPIIPGFPTTPSSYYYSPAYYQFMFDNRQRTKADFAIDVVAFRGVTISPTVRYQDDYYGLNPLNQDGMDDSKSTSWGVDVGYVVSPDLSFTASYYWEDYNQLLYSNSSTSSTSGSCATPPPAASCFGPVELTRDKQYTNSVTAAMNWGAIPGKLDVNMRYEIADGVDEQDCSLCSPDGNPFPNDTTLWEHLDATATYKFDPTWVHQAGFDGELKARLRYTWERNSVSNWQNDPLAPYTSLIGSTFLWLAYDNPNYNIQMLAASLIASW